MVRRSSSTSRGTNYWFHCFCFPISRLSGLRMRNFPDLMCLPKSRETKTVKDVLYEVRCLKSNEDMILALTGQFKQLSHEPEKFR